MLKNCHRLLDLTGPLQVGGLPVLPDSEQLELFQSSFSGKSADISFVGCISDLYVEHGVLDLDAAIAEHLTGPGCPAKEERCLSSPCKLGGGTERWDGRWGEVESGGEGVERERERLWPGVDGNLE